MKTAARFLEERMGPAIARITGGRYDQVLVDEKDLAFRVVTPEHAQPVGVESLSRGTADQLYLVARLGLVRLITMDKRPPLILDDPFVTFDAERAERALTLVREVAAAPGLPGAVPDVLRPLRRPRRQGRRPRRAGSGRGDHA